MSSQNQSMPLLATTTTSAELLQAQAELWCHGFSYLKSVALHCAIKLGIPNAINRCGGAASLSELHDVLPVAPSKRPCLSRLMRFLAASGIFREEAQGGAGLYYHLTMVSRLLVDDNVDGGGHACLSPFSTSCVVPFQVMASLRLAEWLENEDGNKAAETPFMMTHGADFWGMIGRDAEFGAGFHEGMRSDSRFVAQIIIRECNSVFAGLRSLVDVGGGDGTMAKAIAKAIIIRT